MLLATLVFTAFEVLNDDRHKNGSGANPGYAGDPAGGNQTCTFCHAGPAATYTLDLISSNIPAGGYYPDSTYTITATISRTGHSKFGFEVSPQNAGGNFLGTLVTTDARTQLRGTGGTYITHTGGGTAGTNSNTWTFDWIAPSAGTGQVIFFGSFLVANSNNANVGDTVYYTSLEIPENPSAGIDPVKDPGESLSVFPNPAVELITVKTGPVLIGSGFFISDLSGKNVLYGTLTGLHTHINVSSLPAGIYILRIEGDAGKRVKFMVER